MLETFVQAAMRNKQEVLIKKTEQLNMYATMLSNPNIPHESMATVRCPTVLRRN